LVSEWTFNSPAVANITEDSWGNNNGTLMGANGLPQLQSKENCVYGTCYLFDGFDDYMEVSDNVSLDISSNITITAWIKLENIRESVYEAFVSKLSTNNDTPNSPYGLWAWRGGLSAGGIVFRIMTGTGVLRAVQTNSSPEEHRWYHIVGTYDGSEMKIYQDGSLKNTTATTDSIQINDKPLRLGYWSESDFFNGFIDDVRIYNNALSSSQIKQEYVAGLNSLLANNNISKEEYNLQIESLASK